MSLNGAESRPLPAPVKLFLFINAFLGIAAAVFIAICRFRLHLGYPYNNPLTPSPGQPDLRTYFYRFLHFREALFFSPDPRLGPLFAYPAPVAFLYKALYLFRHDLRLLILTAWVPTAASAAWFTRKLVTRGISWLSAASFTALTLLFSFPFWFAYRQGNVEIYIFLLIAGATYCYLSGYLYTAAILFGIATSMKIFPGVYFALFLSRKHWKPMIVGVLSIAAINFASLWILGPSVAVASHGIAAGLADNREHFMLHYLPLETSFDHSIFGFIKRLFFTAGTRRAPEKVLSLYLLAVGSFGILLYFLRIRRLPLLNQILSLSVVAVLLPPTSHDYTLMHLYVPFVLLVLYAVDKSKKSLSERVFTAYFICFGILFSFESEAIHSGAAFSAQIKCLALIALLALACWYKLPNSVCDTTIADSKRHLRTGEFSA